MQRQDFLVKSAVDGLEIRVVTMVPDAQIHGIIQIAHGMAEHKERYFDFMEYLASNGYVAVINDHRGHGESIINPEDLGYFYDPSGVAIVEDLHQITLEIKKRFTDVPVILFGHSMGSLVVRSYLKKYEQDIDKLIVCGSPGKNPLTGIAMGLVRLLKKIKGERHRSAFFHNLAFGSNNKKVGEKELNAWLCNNKEIIQAYNEDALCGFTFTLNGFENLFCLLKDTYSRKNWKVQKPQMPVLFIAGENDPVILGEKGWLEAQSFLLDLGYESVDGILYDEMRHEIINEPNASLVYSDILDWVSGKLKTMESE